MFLDEELGAFVIPRFLVIHKLPGVKLFTSHTRWLNPGWMTPGNFIQCRAQLRQVNGNYRASKLLNRFPQLQ